MEIDPHDSDLWTSKSHECHNNIVTDVRDAFVMNSQGFGEELSASCCKTRVPDTARDEREVSGKVDGMQILH